MARIIEKERPDAILPTMGGQTALNCAMDLVHHGVLRRWGVELIGATPEAIDKAEDRERFKEADGPTSVLKARARAPLIRCEEALCYSEDRRFPGRDPSELYAGRHRRRHRLQHGRVPGDRFERGLELSPTSEVLIEESLLGWKEYEMEVVRDTADNCIIVCSIENLDPMGVHTGDSITVAPAQTLTDTRIPARCATPRSPFCARSASTRAVPTSSSRSIRETGRMIVIEMNPRVSRSSALASKATGFPIAKIAAKLAVGYTLDELKNEMTGGKTPASFEPAIDYVVTKVPRFAFEKFPAADDRLTTQMKSVGEVMAIGRTFEESLQKALRGLETGKCGLDPITTDRSKILCEIAEPGPERIFYVADGFRIGMTVEEIFELSKIDPWFLRQIDDLVESGSVYCRPQSQ